MHRATVPFIMVLLLLVPASCKTSKAAPPKIEIVTIDTVVGGSTKSLLEVIREKNTADSFRIAYVGIDNQSAAEMGETMAEANQKISEVFANSSDFILISERLIDAARAASGVRKAEELMLKEPRHRFVGVLTEEGQVPDYLMFGNFTSIDQEQDAGTARRFRLTLQMVHSGSGVVEAQKSGTFTAQPKSRRRS